MTAKFKPGDVVRWDNGTDHGEPVTVLACTESLFIFVDEAGAEDSDFVDSYVLAPPPLPEPYIGYTHGNPNSMEGVPTVYPLSIFHGSDTFYGYDVYEVEVRYIRKLDTSQDKAS